MHGDARNLPRYYALFHSAGTDGEFYDGWQKPPGCVMSTARETSKKWKRDQLITTGDSSTALGVTLRS